ncbi:unnamed protein product, partial [Mesorhabditis belari]|uniref:Uncharacterized protein n=1 Tax=Mesorhabditis belari TaxID=2138241 RepID=A0AAF3E962_9BILA
MSDDLSALFAKRKEKKQKKNVVSMDAVGEVLQRRARKQEELMAAEVEEEKRSAQDEAFLKRTAQEESDWIDSYENDIGRFEGLKIKDMGAEETDEDEILQAAIELKNNEEVQHKGWGAKKNESEDDEMPGASEMAAVRHNPPAPTRYVPPNSRGNRAANLDLNNQEMFPTIGAADEIEKHHKEDKKNPWGTPAGAPAQAAPGRNTYLAPSRRGGDGSAASMTEASMAAARSDAIAAVRAMSAAAPTANVRPMATSQAENTATATPTTDSTQAIIPPKPTPPVDTAPKKTVKPSFFFQPFILALKPK